MDKGLIRGSSNSTRRNVIAISRRIFSYERRAMTRSRVPSIPTVLSPLRRLFYRIADAVSTHHRIEAIEQNTYHIFDQNALTFQPMSKVEFGSLNTCYAFRYESRQQSQESEGIIEIRRRFKVLNRPHKLLIHVNFEGRSFRATIERSHNAK
jgi:thymidylate synthase